MSVQRWASLLLTVATAGCAVAMAGCTVTAEPGAEASGSPSGPSGSAPGSAGSGCPWTETNGQGYEPETGRVKLVSTCLDAQTAGGLYRTAATTDRADRYTDGTPVAVLCIDFGGESYRDRAGYSSKIWFKVDGTFATGDGQGYVPHAAAGYAAINAEDAC